MRKIRGKVKPEPSRIIPSEGIGNFEAPDLTRLRRLKDSDTQAIMKLAEELRETGVISREVSDEPEQRQTMEEVNGIFADAAQVEQYEKQLNTEFYDEDVDKFLDAKDLSEKGLHDDSPYNSQDFYFNDEENRSKRRI